MSDDNIRVLSYALLAGTGIYCWYQVKDESLWCPHVCYGIISVNNLVAVILWMKTHEHLFRTFRFTSYCQLLFALPAITTTVWLQNGYQKEYSYAWVIVSFIPLICYILNADMDMPLADLIILLNLVGLGAVSFIKDIRWGIGATAAYAISHYFVERGSSSNLVVYNVGLSIYAYLALRAIGFGQ